MWADQQGPPRGRLWIECKMLAARMSVVPNAKSSVSNDGATELTRRTTRFNAMTNRKDPVSRSRPPPPRLNPSLAKFSFATARW